MAYSELIKDFARIRSYMRQFFVYGFKSRREFDQKSARSYDNERRRVESWLADYMAFRREKDGKRLFIAVDSRTVAHNPLYQAFKAKTFTDKDITLHFLLLDALAGGEKLTARQLAERFESDYLAQFDAHFLADESTLRKKLAEYESLGLLRKEKRGREVVYSRDDANVDLPRWRDAVALFSEIDPLGVVGSTLLDKLPPSKDVFSFKHHYILRALESEILYSLLCAIDDRLSARITLHSRNHPEPVTREIVPLMIRVSTQDGRYYLLGWPLGGDCPSLTRLDRIVSVVPGDAVPDWSEKRERAKSFLAHLWGASYCAGAETEHVEMVVRAASFEHYIVDRLRREKRCGRVEQVSPATWRFTADVYDAMELLPWLRTFIGRVISLESSNAELIRRFRQDTQEMLALYGGEDDALS